jgi:hypothetical protein
MLMSGTSSMASMGIYYAWSSLGSDTLKENGDQKFIL